MNYKSISISAFDLLHFVKIISIEFLYCLTIYFGYAIFSMLFFGEGANSFMYSASNGFIYLGLIFLPPTIFNLYKFVKHYKNGQLSKSKNYFLIQIILAFAFVLILVTEAHSIFY